ncbi:MAG: hypothetical protein EON52_17805, partial [Actinomycetales bacterium]
MRTRLTLSAGLAVCALLATAPALAGTADPADPAGPRVLHPQHSSGGDSGTRVLPFAPSGRTTTTDLTNWEVAPELC